MNIELNNLNKFVCLEKIVFSNKEILTESIEFLSKNISKDYDIIICERGEGIASCFELYAIFESLLKEFGLNNKVYIFTETEVSEYYEFIKNRFGWECIFLTAFYDMPRMYQRLYNLDFPYNFCIKSNILIWCHSQSVGSHVLPYILNPQIILFLSSR